MLLNYFYKDFHFDLAVRNGKLVKMHVQLLDTLAYEAKIFAPS